MHLVALQCVLVITGFLGGGEGQTLTITRDQDKTNPPVEHVEVNEGDTLTMKCAASKQKLHFVYWGKNSAAKNNYWLTQNSVVETNDRRVSVGAGWGDFPYSHYIYSMQISVITTKDSGKYICFVTWYSDNTDVDREGYVYVSVRNFPKEQPVCSTNQTANSTSDSVYLWCDTVKGYPGVNVSWTVDGTGDDDIANSSVVDYLDSAGRERVQTELRLITTDWGNHWTREFVCTVTSSAFPGFNRTCSVNVTVERHVTTEAYFDGNVLSTGTGSSDSGSHDSGSPDFGSLGGYTNDETTSESVPDPKGSDDAQIPGSSAVGSTLAVAIVIPAFVIALFILLICVLKRKRQRKTRRGRNTKRTTSPIGPNKDRGGEVVVPYSVKQLQINDNDADISNSANNPGTPITGEERNVSPRAGQFDLTSCRPYSVTRQQQKQTVDSGVGLNNLSYESYQPPAGDVKDRASPYEVELDLNGESAGYSQIPDEYTTRDINGQQSGTDYEKVQSEYPDERQEDNNGYEPLHLDRKIQTNLSRKSGGLPPETITPSLLTNSKESTTISRPLYEPLRKGQDRALAKPGPQADESRIYQMIN